MIDGRKCRRSRVERSPRSIRRPGRSSPRSRSAKRKTSTRPSARRRSAYERRVWAGMAPGSAPGSCAGSAISSARRPTRSARSNRSDTGKPLGQATAEVVLAADFFTYFATLAELPDGRTHPVDAGYFVYSKREPYGVVGAISPWNYPFLLACWKTAPALAVGNSVVLKMAEQSPLSTSHLARIVLEAGMPAGVFNVVHGDGPTTGAALVAHPDVPKLTFTGSTVVGKEILRVIVAVGEERPPRARRQDPEHHLRRRRPRPGDRRLAVHELLQHRPDLHERHAAARPARRRTRSSSSSSSARGRSGSAIRVTPRRSLGR